MNVPVVPRRMDRLWTWIHEPRIFSAFLAVCYLLVAVAGLAVIIAPVRSIEGQIGTTMTMVWGALLAFGGVVGIPSALRGLWDFERAALLACATGLAIYVSTVWVMVFTTTGNRITQGCLLMVLAAAMAHRYSEIRGAHRDYRAT